MKINKLFKMRLKTYNNGKILAPLKCGTRFLDETFGGHKEDIGLEDLMLNQSILKNIELIVIREPLKHIESVLHTEILGKWRLSSEPSLKDVEKIMESFMYKQNDGIEGGTHYSSHLYLHLYYYWKRNKNKIKVIHLNELSSYLKSKGFDLPEYAPNKYDFNNYEHWYSKEDLMLSIKSNYPVIWDNYMLQVKESQLYYDSLISNTEIPKLV